MSTISALPPKAEFQLLPIGELHPSKTNPRGDFAGPEFDELTRSIGAQGVIVPLVVRPAPGPGDGYEIVAGERRWRAALKAKISLLPCRILSLGDGVALQAQLVENLQRKDLTALEEGRAYRRLVERGGLNAAGIAERLGKSLRDVYAKLQLTRLEKPVIEAMETRGLTAGHALLLARLQPGDQARALKSCYHDPYGGRAEEPVSVRELDFYIKQNLLVPLDAAPWKKDDAELVPKAGPCTTCPKRSGNARELYPDLKNPNTCTDKSCYDSKMQVRIAQRLKENSGAIRISTAHGYSYNEQKALEKRGILSRHQWAPSNPAGCKDTRVAIVAQGHEDLGQVKHVCVNPKCKTHHPLLSPSRATRSAQERQAAAAENAKKEFTRALNRRLVERIVAKTQPPLPRWALSALFEASADQMYGQDDREVLKILGWLPPKGSTCPALEVALHKRLPKLREGELAKVGVLLALQGALNEPWGLPKDLAAAARASRIDPKKIARELKVERRAAKRAQRQAAKAPAAAKGRGAPLGAQSPRRAPKPKKPRVQTSARKGK